MLLNSLTPSELRVAKLVSLKMTNKEVAERLEVCEKTVKYHLSSIYKKLGIKSREELNLDPRPLNINCVYQPMELPIGLSGF